MPGSLAAQDTRATLPDPALDALVAEALSKSPEISAAQAQARAARQRVAPARTLPDPSASVQYQNDGTAFSLGEEDMTFLGAMYSQPLPWPGKLRLAGEEAERRADQVEAERVGRARLAIEARVRRSYYDLALAEALLRLLDDRQVSWREMAGVARERYAAGLAVQQDALRAQIELLRLDETRAELAAQLANRRAEVNRLLRRPAEQPLEKPGTLELRTSLPALGDLIDAVRDRSPELAGARRAIEADRTRVERARKDFLPDFTASAGPMYRGGLDPMWQAGVGVSLPVFSGSRQRPLLAAAREELKSAEAQADSLALDLELATRERWEALKATLAVARLYSEAILPVDRISLESAVASYRTGKVPFVTVLEALNALYADREAYLSRLAEAERRRVAIDEADPAPGEGMAAGGRTGGAAPAMRTGSTRTGSSVAGSAGAGTPAPMGMR
jgi:outer membrane protein TolC